MRAVINTLVPVLLLSTAIHAKRKAVSSEADAYSDAAHQIDIVVGQSGAPMGCFKPLVCYPVHHCKHVLTLCMLMTCCLPGIDCAATWLCLVSAQLLKAGVLAVAMLAGMIQI